MLLSHPDIDFPVVGRFDESDPMPQEIAEFVNNWLLREALATAKVRQIPAPQMQAFVNQWLAQAMPTMPKAKIIRDKIQAAAFKLLTSKVKEAYQAKGLAVTGNLEQINELAEKIEAEGAGNESYVQIYAIATEQIKAKWPDFVPQELKAQ